MSEPLYQFVKGKGWVAGPDCLCGPEYKLADGTTTVRWEMRKPNVGEYYSASRRNTLWWNHSNNEPNWERWRYAFPTRFDLIKYTDERSPDLEYGWDFFIVLVEV